jgi:hypothetical protein
MAASLAHESREYAAPSDHMNEAEWTNPREVLEWLRLSGKITERKARLFAVACCRRIWSFLGDESKQAVELAERFADGLSTREELIDDFGTLQMPSAPPRERTDKAEVRAAGLARDAARFAASNKEFSAWMWEAFLPSYYAAVAVAWSVVGGAKRSSEAAQWAAAWSQVESAEYREQLRLLRDLLGPMPFGSVNIEESWRKPQVISAARHIYEERAFEQMPELAKALESVGCTDGEILSHCRGSEAHVRGCWILDLILGKG